MKMSFQFASPEVNFERKTHMFKRIEDNPKTGALSTVTAFIIGLVPEVSLEMQTLVIFWLQVIAFTISIIVGILTICSYWKKLKNRK